MSKNKNEVTLEVIARTDPKTGAIVLTSRDRQIAGQPFVLRLNGDTPTFTTLKNLLNEEAVENKQVKRLSDLAEQGDTEVELGEGELLLGYGLDGPLTVNLNRHSGVFVYGLTGSGKTALLRNILLSNLGRENLNISAIDFSGQLVEGVADRLQNSIAWSRDSALDFLQGLADMCKSREEPLRSCEYVFIDEIDMLSKPYQQQDFIDALDTIQTQGRAIGVHLFVGAQRLDWLSESFLAGFGHRIVMGSVSSKMGLRSLGEAPRFGSGLLSRQPGLGILRSHPMNQALFLSPRPQISPTAP